MKTLLVLIVPSLLLSCSNDQYADGWDTTKFEPHKAKIFRQTPGGHLVDDDPKKSIDGGFLTKEEVDAAVDLGYRSFAATFPGYYLPSGIKIHLTDDYVFWYLTQWAGGAYEPGNVMLPIWTRGTSDTDPGAQFIKRKPDSNYSWWRYTSAPIAPALVHELLHASIDDPGHARPEWSMVGSVSGKANYIWTRGRCEPAP